MNRFTGGLIAGGIIGVVSVTVASRNRKSRKQIVKSGKMIADRTESVMDNIKDKIW